MDKQTIKAKAKKIYKTYGTINPFVICKEKDFVVKKIDMPPRLKGYTTTKNRIRFIYINNSLSEEEQKFTCAHELGHIICGHDENVIFTSRYTLQVTNKHENEANLFAVALLINNIEEEDIKHLTINQLSKAINIKEDYLYLFF